MTRGDLITVAGSGPYGRKPRPAIIIQSDDFPTAVSVTVCPLTNEPVDAPLLRLRLEPDGTNGLAQVSWAMIDKITTVRRSNAGRQIGRLSNADLTRVSHALLVFLGLAGN